MNMDWNRFDDGVSGSGGGTQHYSHERVRVFVSTYTNYDALAHLPKATEGKGIYTFTLKQAEKELVKEFAVADGANPNPAFMHAAGQDLVYVVNERIDENGTARAYRLVDSGLEPVGDPIDAAGKSTCYVHKDTLSSYALVVNYWDATISVMSVAPNGALTKVTDVHKRPGYDYCNRNSPDRDEHLTRRQGWSHTHCIVPSPDNRYFFVPDLGEDKIYQFTLDRVQGKLHLVANLQLTKGHGPRHMVFHKTGTSEYTLPEFFKAGVGCAISFPTFPCAPSPILVQLGSAAYVVNELDSTVDVLEYSDVGPRVCALRVVQTVSTIPPGLKQKSHCAEIKVGPSGRFLYVANRFSDSIAVFSIDIENGCRLHLAAIQSSLGCTPRHFAFYKDLMIVTNTDNDSIVLFEVDDKTGLLKYSGKTYHVPSPNNVLIVSQRVI